MNNFNAGILGAVVATTMMNLSQDDIDNKKNLLSEEQFESWMVAQGYRLEVTKKNHSQYKVYYKYKSYVRKAYWFIVLAILSLVSTIICGKYAFGSDLNDNFWFFGTMLFATAISFVGMLTGFMFFDLNYNFETYDRVDVKVNHLIDSDKVFIRCEYDPIFEEKWIKNQ